MWTLFLAATLGISIGSHFYIWLKMRAALVPAIWRFAFIALGILFHAAIFLGRPTRGAITGSFARIPELAANFGFTWFILVVITCISLIFVELIGVIIAKHTPRGILTIGLTLGLLCFLYGLGGAYFVQRRNVQIKSKKLPEGLEHLRIVQLSDVHFGGLYTSSHLARALAIVKEANPDIIVMTGDLVDGDMRFHEHERDMLREVASNARLAFAVNGNHEFYARLRFGVDTKAFIESCGFQLLTDERAEIPDANTLIIGLDDGPTGHLKSLVQPEDHDKLVIVLKHRPNLPVDAEGRFDLQLSGHTHGGQIWPFGYLSSRANGNSIQGLSEQSGGLVYVSNGTGFWGPPIRIGVTPEVTVIDILNTNPGSMTESDSKTTGE